MQGIGNVSVAGDRVICSDIDILRPGRCTYDNQVIRVNRTNSLNHFNGIRLNSAAPWMCIERFVENLINYVVSIAIFSCHFLEESDGLSLILVSYVRVEIDNGIHVISNCRINHSS